uniref:Uncharacterized protein n=1 Tax=Marseillevirus LCMAC101 TaxID=2506602 RepID=A0A481YQE4_9VIRU|nr:MAG: hypothetical protein LCMAC101_00080 [Marseillevirus LCMAC101]
MTTTEDLTFPNKSVKIGTKRDSFSDRLKNLIPRIGFLAGTPVLPKGNILYDIQTNTLYFSNGVKWIPIANAASFTTSTDMECLPDVMVVIEPSSFLTETNVGVALVPRGTGAVSLSAPDLLPAGGNCRGDYAVDLQIQRLSATQIASGVSSNIGGGTNNQAAGDNSHVSGGTANTASNIGASVGGGSINRASGQTSNVAGGSANTASGPNSCVPGGNSNTATGVSSLAAGENAIASFNNSICFSCDASPHVTSVANEFKIGLQMTTGRMTIDNLIAFDDDAAAGAAGLTVGMLFQTTGGGVITTPGVLMIKQ